MDADEVGLRQAHLNTIDAILDEEGETSEMFHYAEWVSSLIEVLPLAPIEKHALKATLWRVEVERELKEKR